MTETEGRPAPVPTVLRRLAAVLFDTDGVLIDSARLHAAAWKTAFDAHLRAHPPSDPSQRRPFDLNDDYPRLVDGRSRLDGAAALLASRGVESDAATVRAVADAKERLFTACIHEGAVAAYPGTVRLLRILHAADVSRAAVSASRHARELLAGAGLTDLLDVLVDGDEAARLHLPGKPDPALFLEAAGRLRVLPGRAAVIEDAPAGVEAGRRGGFALVVGVDRAGTTTARARLLRHGAHLVVGDLAELFDASTRGGRQ
ncbi:HAD-IA family hydrolase [Streptomyces sp. NPDC047315]|uniref:HAD family hydrolase n=1 Tax=Streptomyces sp. NPDC047315 TaxID=3155142 RepID=UPI0033EA02FA